MRGVFFALLVHLSAAWWDTGHILVAEIARRSLQPFQLENLNALLALQVGFYPFTSALPYAGIWMDDIKPSTDAFGVWHYINWPFCNGTLSSSNCTAAYGVPNVNLISQLVSMSNTLSIHATNNNADPWTKSFSLRVLLHLVGDLHQPFHNIGLFTPQFPKGDSGGNFYKVYYNASGTILGDAHSLFDSVAGLFSDHAPKPVTEEYARMIETEASAIIEEFPAGNYSNLLPNITDKSSTFFTKWSQEGYQLAIDKGYALMKYNATLQDDYIGMLRVVLRERIAIGGYRLGYLLSRINSTIAGAVPECPASAASPVAPTATIVVGVVGLLLVLVSFVVGMRVQRDRSHRPIFPLAEE